jgi:tRNA(Ile)-lysidine synthase
MLKKFESYVQKNHLFTKNDSLLLAMSGGADSVVLAYLLKEAGFRFCIAHANFNLRAKDSEKDEKFCQQLAKKLNVPFYSKSFDVKSYLEEHHSGIQVAARNLRYEWFNDLLKKSESNFILTAHHANDVVETLFINLLRGTGINGLKGIPEKNGQIVRPLLHLEKEEILAYAKENGIKFRTDKSNLEDKYKRNYIRLNILPKLKELNPKLEQTFINNSNHFREEASIVKDYLELKALEYVTQTHAGLFINKKKLIKEKYIKSLLHFLISGYGFNVSQENSILKNILSDSLSGKYFFSPSHQLYIDRNDLIIKAIKTMDFKGFKIHSLNDLNNKGMFHLSEVKQFKLPEKNEIYLHSSKLLFPLSVRKRQIGDKFRPFGMSGFKLLSDFIKSEKLNLFQKENCKVLVNGNGEIIWLIGYRSDDRYKVNIKASDLIKLTWYE